MLEQNELDSVIPLHNYFKLRDHPSLNESESPFTPLHTVLKIIKEHLRRLVNRQQDLPTSSYDVVIVSHIINKTRKDIYFGSIVSELRAHGYKVLVCYFNHTKYHFSPQTDEVIIPKSLGNKGDYEAIKELLKLQTFKKNHQYAHSLFSFPNFYNQILRIYFNQLFNKIKYKLVVCTYEGHPWERIVLGESFKANKDALRAAYTAAPLFPDQKSMHLDLTKKYNPDVWFMSGSGQENLIPDWSILGRIQNTIVGTERAIEVYNEQVSITEKLVFLLVPEGIKREELIFSDFAKKAASLYKDAIFIYRLHPSSVISNNLKYYSNSFKNYPNLVLSQNSSLEDDITRASFVIYRGSSVAIQGLAKGKIPIFYNYKNEDLIDVLWGLKDYKFTINDPNGLSKYFDYNPDSHERESGINYAQSQFEKLMPSAIINYIKSSQ